MNPRYTFERLPRTLLLQTPWLFISRNTTRCPPVSQCRLRVDPPSLSPSCVMRKYRKPRKNISGRTPGSRSHFFLPLYLRCSTEKAPGSKQKRDYSWSRYIGEVTYFHIDILKGSSATQDDNKSVVNERVFSVIRERPLFPTVAK